MAGLQEAQELPGFHLHKELVPGLPLLPTLQATIFHLPGVVMGAGKESGFRASGQSPAFWTWLQEALAEQAVVFFDAWQGEARGA